MPPIEIWFNVLHEGKNCFSKLNKKFGNNIRNKKKEAAKKQPPLNNPYKSIIESRFSR
jgi:hypothetical protein